MPAVAALQVRLLELRSSFDRSFAEPARAEPELPLDLLAIRVGREELAMRLHEIAAIEADRTLTPVPSEHPELLGVAGVRGTVVAVFDLAALLHVPRAEGVRWLVLAKGAPMAFAFNAFDGLRSVPAASLSRAEQGRGPLHDVVRHEGRSWPVVDIPALVALLESRLGQRGTQIK